MNGWDIALWVIVGYVAVAALVRLMVRRRDQLLEEFRSRMKAAKKRKQASEQEPERWKDRKKAA